MKFIEERIIPKLMDSNHWLLQEHIDRYKFARKYCKGRVLDIACGVGYGSQVLLGEEENKNKKNTEGNAIENNSSENNSISSNNYGSSNTIDEIVGIDISQETIDYAIKHYSHPKVKFYVDNAINENLHKKYGVFDTVVSFETIEHFKEDELFIESILNLLKDNGTALISTPFGRGKGKPCKDPYHVHQYKEEELLEVLEVFSDIDMYHQDNHTIEKPIPEKEYYLMVAVCKK